MPDNLNRRGPEDPKTVSSQGHELDYLARKYGLTRQDVRDAIGKVGNNRKDVENELKRKKARR